MASASIPVVDFAPFLRGTKDQPKEIAKIIDDAFQNTGFVCLVNHGVDAEKVKDAFKWSKRFFDLSSSIKALAPHPPGGPHHRGYSKPGLEKVSQDVFDRGSIQTLRNIPDVKESFESGNVDDGDQPNIWLPNECLPSFRDFMEGFFLDLRYVVHMILQALAISLDLPEDHLSTRHSQSLFQLRLLHYPPIPRKALEEGLASRINTHSDFGTLTLLFQDAVGGLEIQDPATKGRGQSEAKFFAVEPIQGGVLVNVGDLLERWSNRRWKSTVHRVVAPAEKVGDGTACPEQYSIPFFATADNDADRPKRYESVTGKRYVQMRMAALY
ncbi:thymine dioxygenase [Eremomyces bilateralis CBS 781.70]|uniref:Thymine dioxygenase n=1 Tax=Eremomyces bilateralis CBS 781.70 TaxID=1392243 RepID=A0A6G1FRN5_9PEZI|nr:thymine dioxygenase [Eremomyces bilateralis CBS 781.70]KAF1808351.1 thymine dioxygenase [Eremomyces bilateralis CBS 781.70]